MAQLRDEDDKGNCSVIEGNVVTEVADKPDTKVASKDNDIITQAVALAVVAIGVALVEVELLAGVALGAAAIVAPQIISAFGSGKKKAAKTPEQTGTDEEGAATV